MKPIKPGKSFFKRMYCTFMFIIVGRALQGASRIDTDLINEVAHLPEHVTLMIRVLPDGPSMTVMKVNGHLKYLGSRFDDKLCDLVISVKNLAAAFLLLTFRESTAVSFCRNRMTVSGELGISIALVRFLNIIEVYLLPKFIATRAVKRYPEWTFLRKHVNRVRLYLRIIIGI